MSNEPVAWMVYTKDGQSCYVTDNPTDIPPDRRALPLYTEPFPTDEALLRQALEALEFFRDTAICEADTAVATEAIAALRERLGVKEQA